MVGSKNPEFRSRDGTIRVEGARGRYLSSFSQEPCTLAVTNETPHYKFHHSIFPYLIFNAYF